MLAVAVQTAPVKFQHTAARRRLLNPNHLFIGTRKVSTHSRPKAAADAVEMANIQLHVSTHSRPKAAAFGIPYLCRDAQVSTHSRPKAAAPYIKK